MKKVKNYYVVVTQRGFLLQELKPYDSATITFFFRGGTTILTNSASILQNDGLQSTKNRSCFIVQADTIDGQRIIKADRILISKFWAFPPMVLAKWLYDICQNYYMHTKLLNQEDQSELMICDPAFCPLPSLRIRHFECKQQALFYKRSNPRLYCIVRGKTTFNIELGNPVKGIEVLIEEYEQLVIRMNYLKA